MGKACGQLADGVCVSSKVTHSLNKLSDTISGLSRFSTPVIHGLQPLTTTQPTKLFTASPERSLLLDTAYAHYPLPLLIRLLYKTIIER